MKKIIGFTFLFVSITVAAQKITGDDITARRAITEHGKPDGEKKEMKIDKNGGSISSSDGKVTLIFPEGSLSDKINISIQPVTNLAPNGNGKAYQMEPSGISFEKPAMLIFHYTDEESKDSMQLLLGIAMQDDKGQWFKLKKFTLDTVAKTISGNIKHFCAFVNFSAAKIFPVSARVKANGRLGLKIIGTFPDDTDEDELLAPLRIEYPNIKWSVNAITNGNSAVGIISASQNGTAIFHAPAHIPVQNPVAITAQVIYSSSFNNRYQTFQMVSNITIYEVYEVTILSNIEGSAGSVMGTTVYKDSGSFVVNFYGKEAGITDIKNKNDFWTYNGKCTVNQQYSGKGLINIVGVRSIKVTPAQLPQQPFPKVNIIFLPSKIDMTVLEFTCPDRKGGTTTMSSVFATAFLQSAPAMPINISFDAKEGEQILEGSIGKPGDKLYQKISVKRLNDE